MNEPIEFVGERLDGERRVVPPGTLRYEVPFINGHSMGLLVYERTEERTGDGAVVFRFASREYRGILS